MSPQNRKIENTLNSFRSYAHRQRQKLEELAADARIGLLAAEAAAEKIATEIIRFNTAPLPALKWVPPSHL